MSPATRLARLPGRILWCVHMGNFSPIGWDATVIALWTLVTLL